MKKYLVVIVLLSILQLEAAHNRYTGNILVPDKFGDLLSIKPQNFLNDPAHYVDQLPLESVLALVKATSHYLQSDISVPDKFNVSRSINLQNFLDDPADYVDQLPLESVLALAYMSNRLYLQAKNGEFFLHELIPGNLELLLALRGDIGFTSLLTQDSLERLEEAIAFLELETAKKLIQELKRQGVKRFVPSGYR